MFGLGVGPVSVSLSWKNAALTFAWMTQPNPTFGEPIANPTAAAEMLGLSPAAVAGTSLPVQVVSCGVPFLFVPLTTRRAVDSASLDIDALAAFYESSKKAAHGVFIFSAQPGSDKATVYSRMFAPNLGVVEDPATGSASGPPALPSEAQGRDADKARAMLSLQGVKMGRPSHVHISIGATKNDITSVRVGGEPSSRAKALCTLGDHQMTVRAMTMMGLAAAAIAATTVGSAGAGRRRFQQGEAADAGSDEGSGAGDVQGGIRHERRSVRD